MRDVYRVLVVEDDDVDRRRVHRLLGDNYRVTDAATGEACREGVRSARPDCVLLDYRLPDADGLDLLDDLVALGLPVVMLTGQGSEEVAVEAMKRGAHDYLAKDTLSAPKLCRAITSACEMAALRRQVHGQEAELQRHAQELERSNQDLQQFAYVVSHDLLEPLRSVSSFCGLLKEQYHGKLDETADRWMEKIVGGADRMRTMIQDLLAYSRVGSRGAEFETTDLSQVLQAALNNLSSSIATAAAQVTAGGLPVVAADASQLVQVFQNLIANSIKYRGDAPPRVHVSARRRGDAWEFCVADNGIGIEEEHYGRVFEMFKRLHPRGKYPGNGIGLSICQRIVHRHGGRIWVESTPGEGSRFYFTLPTVAKPRD